MSVSTTDHDWDPTQGCLQPKGRAAVSVLVVIPTLNEAANIERVVAQLSIDIDLPGGTPLIVVADGGSTDDTRAIVQRMARDHGGIKLLPNPRRNQAAALNLAIAQYGVAGGIAIRCDAHAEYPPGYVRSLVAALDRTGADSVVVPMDSFGQSCLGKAVAWVSDTPVGSGGSAHRGGRKSGWIDHGHHAAFLVDSFLANNGGYDEAFVPNEDAEYDCRLRKRGGRVYLDAAIRMIYLPRDTVRGLWHQYRGYGRARSMTIRSHPDSARARQLLLPSFVLAMCASLVAAAVFPPMLLLPTAYLILLFSVSLAIASRRKSLCGLLCGLAAATMHLAWTAGFVEGLVTIRQRRWINPDRNPSKAGPGSPPKTVLVDASLFTAPYDAALSEGLTRNGVPNVLATRPARGAERSLLAPERIRPIFYRHVDDNPKFPVKFRRAAKAFSHVVGLARLVRLSRAEAIEVVHFQWNVISLLDALAIRILRRRRAIVVTVHDIIPFNGARINIMQRLGNDKPRLLADHVIVHTAAGRKALIERGYLAEKITVVPHGPIPLLLAPDERLPYPAARDARHTFTLFGQIKPHKGVNVLVEAIALLPPAIRQRSRVIVAGVAMMDTATIEARRLELGLQDDIEFRFGRLTEAELDALFDETDTFVFPYRCIDASGAYYTVRTLGKWIVASRIGVFNEDFVEDQDGRTVPSGDAAALATALAEATTVPSRPRVPTTTDAWSHIGAETLAIYRIALARLRPENNNLPSTH